MFIRENDSESNVIRLFKETQNLVRDNTVKHFRDKGVDVECRKLSDEEFHNELMSSIYNHFNGYLIANEHNFEIVSGGDNFLDYALNDIVKMIDTLYALAATHGLTEDDINNRRLEMLDELGGFENRDSIVRYHKNE